MLNKFIDTYDELGNFLINDIVIQLAKGSKNIFIDFDNPSLKAMIIK